MVEGAITLSDAVSGYIIGLKKAEEQATAQQELFRLAQWFGDNRQLADLKPYEVAEYTTRLDRSIASDQAVARVKALRAFFTHAVKKGMIEHKLARHVKSRKSRQRLKKGNGPQRPIQVALTNEGKERLELEAERLRAERGPIAIEIRLAAADKDVRENAPLEAAREHLGLVESRIREIEATLEAAVAVKKSGKTKQVGVGAIVAVEEKESGRKTTYTVVSAAEANPLEGKISDVSPVGKALMRHREGDEVVVASPRGKVAYRIVRVRS